MAKKVKVLMFGEAVNIVLIRKGKERGITDKTKNEDNCRLRSFLSKHYVPRLGLVVSIQTYLNSLKAAGRSAGYIRRMRGLLNQFLAYLPTCQLSFVYYAYETTNEGAGQ